MEGAEVGGRGAEQNDAGRDDAGQDGAGQRGAGQRGAGDGGRGLGDGGAHDADAVGRDERGGGRAAMWGTASLKLAKEESIARRSGSMKEMEELAKRWDEEGRKKKEEEEKFAREALWEAERKEKERVENAKREERERAERELREWASREVAAGSVWAGDRADSDSDDDDGCGNGDENGARPAGGAKARKKKAPVISEEDAAQELERQKAVLEKAASEASAGQAPAKHASGRPDLKDNGDDDSETEEDRARAAEARRQRDLDRVRASVRLPDPQRSLPPPRTQPSKITMSFTPAPVDVPAREGKVPIDPAGGRAVEAPAPPEPDASGVAETDPAWLKSKGDEFFKGGDYLSAVSAYTAAIARAPAMAALYSNRAAAQLKAQRFADAVSDASVALALQPKAEHLGAKVDPKPIVKLLLRRGAGHLGLGAIANAIEDYEEAVRLDPAAADPIREDLKELYKQAGRPAQV